MERVLSRHLRVIRHKSRNALQTSERAPIAEYVLAAETRRLEWFSGVAPEDQDRDAFD